MDILNLNVLGNTLELSLIDNKISIRSNNLQELLNLSKQVVTPLIRDNITMPFYYFSSTKFNSYKDDIVDKETLNLFTSYKLFGNLLNDNGTHISELIKFRKNLINSNSLGKFNSVKEFNETSLKSGRPLLSPVVFILGDFSSITKTCSDQMQLLINESSRLGIFLICFDYTTSLPEVVNPELYSKIDTVLDFYLEPKLSYHKGKNKE